MSEQEKSSSWVESPFRWIDKFESESTRRIIQNLITYTLWAMLAGTAIWIWAKRDWFTAQSKSFWNILQYPIQLKIWIIIIAVLAVVWTLLSFRRNRNSKSPSQSDGELQKKLLKQNEQLSSQLKELNEKIQLSTQDPKFLEILNYIIDEGRARGLRAIVETCLGSVDKGVQFIQQSETFDEFMGNAGLRLDVIDAEKTSLAYPNLNGHFQFGVPAQDNPLNIEFASVTIEGNKIVHMNRPAHRHFDWSFVTFKKHYDLKFGTSKGMALIQESSKAAAAIYEKYLPFLSAYPDCVFPLVGMDDTEEKYRKRIIAFENALAALSGEMQSKEIFIVRKEKLKNLHRIISNVWHWVNANKRYHVAVSRYESRAPTQEELATAERIDSEITETESEVVRLEPLVKRDFEFLVTNK
jgi:hypothetical protein